MVLNANTSGNSSKGLLNGRDGFQEVSVTHSGKIYVGFLCKQLQLEIFPAGGQSAVFPLLFC